MSKNSVCIIIYCIIFEIVFVNKIIGQSPTNCLISNSIDSLEMIINDSRNSYEMIANSIVGLDNLYWAAAPKNSGKYFARLKEIAEESQSEKIELEVDLMNIRKYFNQSDFLKSLEVCKSALEKAIMINDQTKQIKIMGYMVMLNNSDRSGNLAGLDQSADYYLNKMDELVEVEQDLRTKSSFYQTKAGFLITQKKLNEAINLLLQNEAMVKEGLTSYNRLIHLAYTYNLLGRCYMTQNQFKKAEWYLNKAQKITEDYQLNGIKYIVYLHKGFLNEKLNKIDAAETFFSKSAGEIPVMSTNKVPIILKSVSGFYERHSRYKEAFDFLKQYSTLNDSLLNIEIINSFLELQENLDMTHKTLEIERLNLEKQNIKTQNRHIKIYLILLVCILILTYYFGLKYLQNRQKLIHETQQKEMILSWVAHDIRSPLIGLKFGLPELILGMNKIDFKKLDQYLNYIYHTISDINMIIDNVFGYMTIERKMASIVKTKFHLKTELLSTIEEIKYKSDAKKIEILVKGKLDYWVLTDRVLFNSISKNVLDNAVKFSNENSIIEIDSFDINGMIKVSFRDFGIGLSNDDKNKLFTVRFPNDEQKSKKFTGSGIGLFISKKLGNSAGMDIEHETVPKGAKFNVYVPLSMN